MQLLNLAIKSTGVFILLQELSLQVLYKHFYKIGFNKESVKIVNVISIGLKTKFWTPSVILIVLMYKL